MIIPDKIKSKYDFYLPYFIEIQKILDNTLLNYCKENHFAYTSRIKTIESVSEKIESGRYSNWDDIDDLIACVIIIPNLSYEESVIQFLQNIFIEEFLKKKGSRNQSYEVFRFNATRFCGRLNYPSDNQYLTKINFEVQICSAFEHAWSVTTHDLAYKSQSIDWKILRLAAQLKSTVEQLDMITLGASQINKYIIEHQWPETVIKSKIADFIINLFNNKSIPKIPEEVRPKDLSRLVDNIYTLLDYKSKKKPLIKELENIFNTINKNIEELLKKDTFPMSLSFFQIIFGILLKENFIKDEIIIKRYVVIDNVFIITFPELKEKKFIEFKV